MSDLTIRINVDNAAFQDGDSYNLAAQVLRVSTLIDQGLESGTIMDGNGNTVGEWEVV
jgi:hypothetical protein